MNGTLCQLSTKCAAFVTAVYFSGLLEEHFQSLLIWEVRNVWPIYRDPHAGCKMVSLQPIADVCLDLQIHYC